ncbi:MULTISPECIES: hypothetical protein [Methylobacterium]|uniref:Uncharacterized protein n=1 Tax=Methylobacterium radiotolerans TaxID=31998 RepID=A0ABV2NU21_9HYPH|nr:MULTISPECIES: hypothetical protein [unclassified Methylobacterium]MBP2498376.1 hypothetical protein [Methylobacterium sp. PvP105]MBP2505760.1 hypothetical protein [Methylobacterium sp. PvP109]
MSNASMGRYPDKVDPDLGEDDAPDKDEDKEKDEEKEKEKKRPDTGIPRPQNPDRYPD